MGLFDRKKKPPKPGVKRALNLGLGDLLRARERLLNRRHSGHFTEVQAAALQSIEDALNAVRVPVNLSCVPGSDQDLDGVQDLSEIREILLSGCCEVDKPADDRGGVE